MNKLTMLSQISLILIVSELIHSIHGTRLIPFGIDYSDRILQFDPLTNVGEPILLSQRYKFFNESYDTIRLSKDGLIIFMNRSDSSSIENIEMIPMNEIVSIAPYWLKSNAKNDSVERVFYREIFLKNNESFLNEITKLIRNGFPNLARQRMLWALIVTWSNVTHEENITERNTFQTILATNGFYSFTLFNYYRLDWSQDSSDNYSRIGFYNGKHRNPYHLKYSSTPSVIQLVNESNIGRSGQFVYHTSGHINDVQCETTTGLQVSPFRGSIYGGYQLRFYGLCFTEMNYQIRLDGQLINDCQIINQLYIVCTMPMVMDSGQILIELFDSLGEVLIGSTDFYAFVPQDHGEMILRNYNNLTEQIADPHNNHLILQFQSNEITKKYLFKLVIYDYGTQLSSDDQTLINRTRQRLDLGYGYLNLSDIDNLTIPYDQIFSVQTDPIDRVHALQISFEIEHQPGWIRQALFLGAKIFTAATSIHAAYCPAWLLLQRDPEEYLRELPPCPCQVPSNPFPEDFFGFHIDEGCDGRKPADQTCKYHPKARSCYRKRSDTSWSGVQCCYNDQGLFIQQGEEGAGTLDVVSPDANGWFKKNLSMFGHFFSDFFSYWSCCRTLLISEDLCQAYYRYRPAGYCENYESESIEQYADLHFLTLNGSSFNMHEEGEFTFLSIPQMNQEEVQIRLQSNDQQSIGITSIVIGLFNGQRRIQFEYFSQHQQLELRIDQKLIDTPDEQFSLPFVIYEDEQMKVKRKSNGTYKISFPKNPFRFRIRIDSSEQYLQLETLIEKEKFRKYSFQSFGLIGDLNRLSFSNGTLININNETDQQIIDEFVQSWRVPIDKSLFFYSDPLESNKNYPTLVSQNFQASDLMNINHEYCSTEKPCSQSEIIIAIPSEQLPLQPLVVTVEETILPQLKSIGHGQSSRHLFRILVLCLSFVRYL